MGLASATGQVLIASAYGPGFTVFRGTDDDTRVATVGEIIHGTGWVTNTALAPYGAAPASSGGHYFVLTDLTQDHHGSAQLSRWTIGDGGAGATPGHEDLRVGAFAESDGLVFSPRDAYIDTMNLSNPLSPTVKHWNSPGAAYAQVVVQGNFLYALNTNANQVEVFQFDGTGSLTRLAILPTTGSPNGLAVTGRWLFVATDNGLRAWDVDDPSGPVSAGSIAMTSAVAVAARPGGAGTGYPITVVTVDMTGFRTLGYDGAAFTPLDLPLPVGQASTLSLTGPLALVSGQSGTTVVDVSDPRAPWVTRSALSLDAPVMQGGYLVGLATFGDPGGPVFDAYSRGTADGTSPFSGCSGDDTGAGTVIHRNGSYLLSCGDNGVTLFQAADGRDPRLLAGYDISRSWTASGAALATDGYRNYVGGPKPADPSQPVPLYAAMNDQNPSGLPAVPAGAADLAAPRPRFAVDGRAGRRRVVLRDRRGAGDGALDRRVRDGQRLVADPRVGGPDGLLLHRPAGQRRDADLRFACPAWPRWPPTMPGTPGGRAPPPSPIASWTPRRRRSTRWPSTAIGCTWRTPPASATFRASPCSTGATYLP